MARLALLLACIAAICANPVIAQTMYKWIDAQGKVQYSDKPPKDFKGEVTKIETDVFAPATPSLPVVKPAVPKAEPAVTLEKPVGDIGSRRRDLRERLAADVARARDRLEAARKERDGGGDVGLDERQVVRQTFPKGTQPGTPRSNCREVVGADGKKAMMCPALVPGEPYYERMRQLDEGVARAEEDLEAAERAYRRGVD